MRLWTVTILIVLLSSCSRTSQDEVINGILKVPENRNNPDSRTLKLVYKVLKAKNADSQKVPIVYLQGGPGAPTLIMEKFWENHPLRNDRDIVLMDQRGTGASEANCIEIGDDMFNIARQDLDVDSEIRACKAILSECKETMKHDGVDLAGYNTEENAADFEDLRKELGYEKWNLLGVSYGSMLGLTIMRDFPQGVRSAVFKGIRAPGTDYINNFYRNFEHSLLTVLKRCENNEDCNNRYPNLKERLLISLGKLQSNPLNFEYEGKLFTLNIQDALSMLFASLYDRHSIGNIPLLIEALENRETEPFINALKGIEYMYSLVNWPMNYSVTSNEQLPFYDELAMAESIQQSEIFGNLAISSTPEVEILKYWHTYDDSELEKRIIISEIPTLLISGGLDHVTPISNVTETLKHLKNGYVLIFSDEGHNLFNPCFFQITEDFFNNPFQKPDIRCSTIRNPIEWNLHKPAQKKN